MLVALLLEALLLLELEVLLLLVRPLPRRYGGGLLLQTCAWEYQMPTRVQGRTLFRATLARSGPVEMDLSSLASVSDFPDLQPRLLLWEHSTPTEHALSTFGLNRFGLKLVPVTALVHEQLVCATTAFG